MSGRIIDQPSRRINGVANKDALTCFRRELESLRGVDVNVSGAIKDPKIGEI